MKATNVWLKDPEQTGEQWPLAAGGGRAGLVRGRGSLLQVMETFCIFIVAVVYMYITVKTHEIAHFKSTHFLYINNFSIKLRLRKLVQETYDKSF